MPSNSEVLKLEIRVDDKDGAIKIRQLGGNIERVAERGEKGFLRIGKSVGGMNSKLSTSKKLIATFITGVVAYKLKQTADHFIETASSMDMMRLSLDTITKGHGDEWFERLNEWALKMPVNTGKAIEAFTMMRAMGLQPTIEDMTTLVDTTSALGGDSGALEGIARALGQIKTKGKVSAEELMQLAERGIPAYEILKEKLGLTSEEVANIGNQAVSGDVAVRALLEGMTDRFGGQSVKMQTQWAGLIESLRSYRTEFERLTMASGPMDALREGLGDVVEQMDEWRKNGQLQEWAEETARGIITAFQAITVSAGLVYDSIMAIKWGFSELAALYYKFNAFQNMVDYNTYGKEHDLKESQESTIRANAWSENAEETANSLRNTNDQIGEILKKLSEYKTKSTETAEKVTEDNEGLAESYKKVLGSITGNGSGNDEGEGKGQGDFIGGEDGPPGGGLVGQMTQWESLSSQVATGMQQNFSNLFFSVMHGEWEGFESFGMSVLDSIGQTLAEMASQQLIQGLFGTQGAGSGGLGGGGGLLGTVVGLLGSFAAAEKGLAYETVFGAKPVFMAKGGIFNQPFAVPMANGGVAIGSEFGQEEAIMPLQRTASGHLGVRASFDGGNQQGHASGGDVTNNHYTYEIKAIDARSFQELCERNPSAIVKPFTSEAQGGNRELLKTLRSAK